MKKKQPKYYVATQSRYVTTFKQFIQVAREYPNSRISMIVKKGLPGSCVFFEGVFYDNRVFTNKQRKFLKDNFEVHARSSKSVYLGKFQRRQVKRKFIKLWSTWSQDRRSHYIQAKGRQLQRESSAFPGCPTFQECINALISDLISMGCKDVYI